jgi:hypothetical protein
LNYQHDLSCIDLPLIFNFYKWRLNGVEALASLRFFYSVEHVYDENDTVLAMGAL